MGIRPHRCPWTGGTAPFMSHVVIDECKLEKTPPSVRQRRVRQVRLGLCASTASSDAVRALGVASAGV